MAVSFTFLTQLSLLLVWFSPLPFRLLFRRVNMHDGGLDAGLSASIGFSVWSIARTGVLPIHRFGYGEALVRRPPADQ